MVVGPGCKLKGERMKERVVGQTVKSVSGNAFDRHNKKPKKKKTSVAEEGQVNPEKVNPFNEIIGKKICDVKTIGKELFVFFEECASCLRVHFLMAGGFRLNGQNIDGDGGGEAETASLCLQLSKDLLRFNKSSTELQSADECLRRRDSLCHLDICADTFSHPAAVERVLQERDRMMCDVLLDQVVLPGVGNIIKNEALFDSGIKPDSRVKELTKEHITHLVKMTRDFSMLFYKCRRDGKNLNLYLKIYRKGKCGQCGGKVVNTKMGESSERLTSFCSTCQVNKLRTSAMKNSLIGWVKSGVSTTTESDWTCTSCTLKNKANRSNCEACLTPQCKQLQDVPSQTTPALPLQDKNTITSQQKRKYETPQKSGPNVKRNKITDEIILPVSRSSARSTRSSVALSSASTVSFGSMGDSLGRPPTPLPTLAPLRPGLCIPKPLALHPRLPTSGMAPRRSGLPPEVTVKQDACQQLTNSAGRKPQCTSQSQQPAPGPHPGQTPSVQPPSCGEHKIACLMREVRKKGPNEKRFFWACPKSRGNCSFFQWADDKFPICEGHGKTCVIRTVLKQGENNGRKFFTCRLQKQKSCSYFEWADAYDKITIR